MSDELCRLFERAEREIRPEFRAQLLDLLQADHPGDATPGAGATDESALVVEVSPPRRGRERRWQPGGWLAVAAAVALLVVTLQPVGDREGNDQSTAGAGPAQADCALATGSLGTVVTGARSIRVELMPDGVGFCLVDDATGAPIGTEPALNDGDLDHAPVAEPTIVERGLVDATTYFYVLAIPDGMPVASVRVPDGGAQSFPTRVGRRMLVIGSDDDLGRDPADLSHDLSLSSAAGTVLATLVADRGGTGSTVEEEP